MSLLFNTLSRFVIAFLPRSKHLLILWLQSLSVVILEPKKIKSVTASTFSPSICREVMGQDAMSLYFECWVLSQLFHSPLSPSSRGSLVPLLFLPLECYHLDIWVENGNKKHFLDPWKSSLWWTQETWTLKWLENRIALKNAYHVNNYYHDYFFCIDLC